MYIQSEDDRSHMFDGFSSGSMDNWNVAGK